MIAEKRWTSADLEAFPDDGKRYEITDGRLKISEIPHWLHQLVCGELSLQLGNWNHETGGGQSVLAPGLIFDDCNDVVPDVMWISNERLAGALDDNGHLRIAPEIIAEVFYRALRASVGIAELSCISTRAVVCSNTGSLTGSWTKSMSIGVGMLD